MEPINRSGGCCHRGLEAARLDGSPKSPFDLFCVEAVQRIPINDLPLPPLLVLGPGQETPLVVGLRHPGGCVTDPKVRSAVVGVRAVRKMRRFENQDFLRPAHNNSNLFDQRGGLKLADRIRHFLKGRIGEILTLNSGRVGDPEKHLAPRAVEKTAERLHAPLEFAGQLLELDVFPFTLTLGDQAQKFGQGQGLRCGHKSP